MYLIPGGGKFGIAKVIYVSKFFRNVILLRLFHKTFATPEQAEAPTATAPSDLIYTGKGAIKPGEWIYFGEQPQHPSERDMTRRIVGGDVWVEDEHLGPASEQDRLTLKDMMVSGYIRVSNAVARLA